MSMTPWRVEKRGGGGNFSVSTSYQKGEGGKCRGSSWSLGRETGTTKVRVSGKGGTMFFDVFDF